MEPETALKQSVEIQEAVLAHLRLLWQRGGVWALIGGETTDDGARLRVTLTLETRYAAIEARP